MLTAIFTGISISIIALLIYNNYSKFYSKNIIFENNALVEENEEDPSLISGISDSFIYSSNSNFEIRKISKDYKPKQSSRNISAKSYIVANISTSDVILKKNENILLPIASITKLVTAVMAHRLLNQNQYVILSKNILGTYGNEGRFRLDEKMRIKELLLPLLMVSSNDSAEAIARAYSKGRQNFIREMNNWVNVIGAYKTYFRDPSGLSAQNLSTAEDLFLITKWILENDSEIFDITLKKTETVRMHTWNNPTHFLNLTAYVGGKNGYTSEANRTSIALFKLGKEKQIFLVVLLGSSRRDRDILDLLDEAVR